MQRCHRQEVSRAVLDSAGRHRRRWIYAAVVGCLAVRTTAAASKLGTTTGATATAFGHPRVDRRRVPVWIQHARSSTTSTSNTALFSAKKGFGASKKTTSSLEISHGKSILKRLQKSMGARPRRTLPRARNDWRNKH
jgi:hypothetical protein